MPAASIDDSEAREITIPMRHRDAVQSNGNLFMKHWALPNVFFQISSA